MQPPELYEIAINALLVDAVAEAAGELMDDRYPRISDKGWIGQGSDQDLQGNRLNFSGRVTGRR